MSERRRYRDPPERGTLGWALEYGRLRRGWTKAQTCEHFDINQSTYYRWIKNQAAPADDNRLAEVADFTGKSIGEIRRLIHGIAPDESPAALEQRMTAQDERLDRLEARLGSLADLVEKLLFGAAPKRQEAPKVTSEFTSEAPPDG